MPFSVLLETFENLLKVSKPFDLKLVVEILRIPPQSCPRWNLDPIILQDKIK
jgi:hypothetical protein